MAKKILMICYYYPPLTDVGGTRSVAFSKYFKQFGWEPYVLSVKNPDKTYCSIGNAKPPEGVRVTYSYSLFNVYKFFGKLNGLLSRILKLFRIKHERNYFYDIFCVPDIFIGWLPLTFFKARKLIKKHDIDAIYVSCSPFSAGIIGSCLKRATGKPLAIDYRDPFGLDISQYQRDFGPLSFKKRVDKKIANWILKSCDIFTVTTEETRQLYIDQFPFAGNKMHTVYNGFDHAFLDDLGEQQKFQKFTIIYTGNFYYDVRFDYFFEGMGILKKNNEINKSNFQFLFYGGYQDRIQEITKRYGVADLVTVKSRIPFSEVLKEIKRSHLQLLRIMQPMISTKLFEGIALDTPFLATIPPGEVEQIIKRFSPGSSIVTNESPQTVAESIKSAMSAYKTNTAQANDTAAFLKEFSRENQSRQLAGLIESVS